MKLMNCLSLFLLVLTSQVCADDWPQFLGPNRTGISAEKNLIDSWPAGGLPELWRVPGGVGMSGIVVVDSHVITTVQKDGAQWAIALEAKSGERLWSTELAPAFMNGQGNGPRGTPAVSGKHVYVFTGEGILAALKLSTGELIWKKDTLIAVGLRASEYGMACSPLVVDDKVVVMTGGAPGSLAAFAAKDGKLIWNVTSRDQAGYSSPALLELSGTRQLVAFTGSSAIGVEPSRGQTQWRYTFETDFACNIMTPIAFQKNMVFLSAGENHGCVMLNLDRKGNSYEVSEVWSSLGRRSVLRSAWQTGIVDGKYLYGFDNVGPAGPVMHYTCVDLTDGSRQWAKQRFGKGNHIAADGKLFIATMAGELVVLTMDPEQYVELGRMQVIGKTRQSPTLSGGRLYLRDDREIVCIDARK
ncbi:MAG: PQQ-binding-like beta-propeller repeat protein [Pirellulaceae bacterium]